MNRARRYGIDLALLARTAGRMALEDPLNLLVQGARRVLPRLRGVGGPRRGLLGALVAFIQDQPALARRLLEATPAPADRLRRELYELLSVQLGLRLPPGSSERARARAAWQAGELSEAVGLLSDHPRSRLRARLWSEQALMQPGARLRPLPRTPVVARGDGVLAVITNARPYTQSGYTMRTQHTLGAVATAGRRVDAVTRIGYPATVGLIGTATAWTLDRVHYHRLPARSLPAALDRRLSAQAQALVSLVDTHRPQLLHTTTDWTNAVVTDSVARACDLPWVYEMRGLLELTWLASRPAEQQAAAAESERVRLLRAKEAELARAADAVVVLSEVQRAEMVARGVPDERIRTIPNAVDSAVFERARVSPAEARASLGLPREGLWVGSVTSVVDYEGLDTLIDAVALARRAGVDVRCAIVGDGVARPQLVAQVERLGLDGYVLLPGRVPPSEAAGWYEALDVFAVPRRNTEVCRLVTPVKPLEAMAMRRPVVASDLPALAEIVGDAGLLSPAGDPAALSACLAELSDPALRERYGDVGRKQARTRTWQRAAGQYEELYRTIVDRHGRG
ncbi:glycosyltransferase family 4 protein [Naumannella halotolerans]|uniref:Glycosyltransferase involved in cell wall biosynthesis n=1 Tax=Naumannella halotolerans TaxID=993414 RepID=A0A4R7IYT8_9ACTN|nr:glycosyltransferase family 4 protein [Naumannella halotolerans]TDT29952.1 glycosyltransferase involved in cell wall biosynthesis [Naumannella halotolerans]